MKYDFEFWFTLGLYLITMLCMVTYGILGIIEERRNSKEKDYEPDYTGFIMTILCGLTPGSIIIGALGLFVCFFYCIIEGPNWLLKKI